MAKKMVKNDVKGGVKPTNEGKERAVLPESEGKERAVLPESESKERIFSATITITCLAKTQAEAFKKFEGTKVPEGVGITGVRFNDFEVE